MLNIEFLSKFGLNGGNWDNMEFQQENNNKNNV